MRSAFEIGLLALLITGIVVSIALQIARAMGAI
jgi:hypothetical protein